MATYKLSNGYANGTEWGATTDADAIKECERTSDYMNSSNWLFRKGADGRWAELGRTRKDYFFWSFVPNEGVTIDGETIKYPLKHG